MEANNVNYHHKDRFFRFLFGNEKWKENTLDLYNALNDTAYTNVDDLEITTIDDVIFMGMKNDVSFMLDSNLNLYEHQSTFNPNMPIRGLMYFSKLYDKYIKSNNLNIYGSTTMNLPVPRFVVFYNGDDRTVEKRTELRLTDLFDDPEVSDIEVTAHMIDINSESEDEILQKCSVLSGYSYLVSLIQSYSKTESNLEDAVLDAVDKCIEDNILKDVLLAHKSEVFDMLLTEYNEKEVLQQIYEEGKAEGEAKGKAEGKAEGIAEGLEIGSAEGEDRFAELTALLLKDNRADDLSRAAIDKEYRNSLFKEFDL